MDCPICKNDAGYFFKNVNNHLIYKCNKCELLWVDGMTTEEVVSFYNGAYFNNDSKMGYKNYLADEKNHRKNAKNILNIANSVKDLTGLKVLDIGCAYGFLLDEARSFKDCDCYGSEINTEALEYARDVLKLRVANSGVDNCHFDYSSFDVVFLIGTIEHLVSPQAILASIFNILKPGGILVITTPDTRGWMPLYSLKPPEHLYYYNHDNIRLLLNNFAYNTLMRKTYFVHYQLHDLFHRLGEFTRLPFLGYVSCILKKAIPHLSLKIPTNEMIVIAEKGYIK